VIGPIAKPDKIQFVPGLPKTRSGKISCVASCERLRKEKHPGCIGEMKLKTCPPGIRDTSLHIAPADSDHQVMENTKVETQSHIGLVEAKEIFITLVQWPKAMQYP
jgi:hypothetical protein